MTDYCYLPSLAASPGFSHGATETQAAAHQIRAYLDRAVEEILRTFNNGFELETRPNATVAEEVVHILLSREFNYQSKGKLAHLVPNLVASFAAVIARGEKLPIYFLFHGGYRAAVGGAPLSHVFAPDITELLLIYQVARLERRIRAVYPPGVSFSIVINNGVAAFTNGIPYDRTNGYVARLRQLIARLDAEETIWVLNQFELGRFEDHIKGVDIQPWAAIDPVDHGVVERFLGRRCSEEEARLKIATYAAAETVWGAEVRGIVAAKSGIFCRQVAHPACPSFRPFPGGAIRVQNGAVAFRFGDAGPVPCFVTPLTWERISPVVVPMPMDLFEGISPLVEPSHLAESVTT